MQFEQSVVIYNSSYYIYLTLTFLVRQWFL